MKLKYTKVLLATAAATALTGCAKHDLIPSIAVVGQAVPTVYWEVGSTSCPAGQSFTFKGKYTVEPGRTPVKSEVWYQMLREDNASATAKLAGTALSYTQSFTNTDTIRSFQCYASFPHTEDYWTGHEYELTGEVPTSRTFSPVRWVEPAEWDNKKFASYFPNGFVDEFLSKVIGYLTDEATAASYHSALRNVYLNYNFTNEQFAAVGLPQLDLSGDDNGTAAKADAWFWTNAESADAITGYYYITLDANNKPVYNEVATDYVAPEGIVLYPVYKASEWLFCRYDDNIGGIAVSVRPEWLPKFRELISQIPFTSWIFDSSDSVYKLEFKRTFSVDAKFRAFDKDSNRLNDASAPVYMGETSETDKKIIELN